MNSTQNAYYLLVRFGSLFNNVTFEDFVKETGCGIIKHIDSTDPHATGQDPQPTMKLHGGMDLHIVADEQALAYLWEHHSEDFILRTTTGYWISACPMW